MPSESAAQASDRVRPPAKFADTTLMAMLSDAQIQTVIKGEDPLVSSDADLGWSIKLMVSCLLSEHYPRKRSDMYWGTPVEKGRQLSKSHVEVAMLSYQNKIEFQHMRHSSLTEWLLSTINDLRHASG